MNEYQWIAFRKPWQEFDRLHRMQDDINSWFNNSDFRHSRNFPAINSWMNEDSIILEVELPGVDPQSVDVSVASDILTLTGERPGEELKDEAIYHRQERRHGKFSRTLQLPFRIQSDQVKAAYKNGLLTITLPRAAEERSRKIQVKTE